MHVSYRDGSTYYRQVPHGGSTAYRQVPHGGV